MNKNYIVIAIVALIVGIAIGAVVGGNNQPQNPPFLGSDGDTNLTNLVLEGDLTVGDATAITGALTSGSTGSFAGLLTLNAGQLRSYTNASTSVGSGTFQLSDLNGYDTILLTPTGAASTKTLTFPASSTLSTWLPTAGDTQETCFVNGTTTAATTITFAASTGIDLEVSTSSPDLILLADNTACFKFIRKSATSAAFDISALMIEYIN